MVGEYTEQDDQPVKKVCQFKRSTLRQCSGLPDANFGYAEGKPCIIIKMNRVRTTESARHHQRTSSLSLLKQQLQIVSHDVVLVCSCRSSG